MTFSWVNVPYLFQRSNIVSSNSEHISFGFFKCCATPEITKKAETNFIMFSLMKLKINAKQSNVKVFYEK